MRNPTINLYKIRWLLLLLMGSLSVHAQKPILISNQQGHLDTILQVAVSPHEHFMATIGQDRQLIIWDYPSAKILRRLQSPHHFKEVWFMDKERVATFDDNNQIRIWEISTGQYTLDAGNPEIELLNYALNADHTLLALQAVNGDLSLYKTGNKNPIWKIRNTPVEGFVHFTPKSNCLILRDELGHIKAIRSTNNGAVAEYERDFFQPEVRPQKLHRINFDKASYTIGKQRYVVNFSIERSNAIPSQSRFDKPVPFVYSKSGNILVSIDGERRLSEYLGVGTTNREGKTYVQVMNLTNGHVQERIYPDNYLSVHLSEDGNMILLIDDYQDIHFFPSHLPENHVRAFVQPAIFHSKIYINTDLTTAALRRFDDPLQGRYAPDGIGTTLRTINFTTREDWQIAEGQPTMSRGASSTFMFDQDRFSTPISVHTAENQFRVLVNFRKKPLGTLVDGTFNYTGLYSKDGKLLSIYDFFTDEVKFSPDEKFAIAKWYTADEEHDSRNYRVGKVYGDIKHHSPYELAVWNYRAGFYIPKEETGGEADLVDAEFLQTTSGIDRFHAFHFDQDNVFSLHIIDGNRTEYWNLSRPQLIAQQEWEDEMIATTFLKDGKRAISTFVNGRMALWEVSTGHIQEEWENIGVFYGIEFSANQSYIKLRNRGKAGIFDLQRGKMMVEVGDERPFPTTMFGLKDNAIGRKMGEVSDLQIDDKSHRAITAHFDGSFMFWNIKNGELLATQYLIDSTDWVVVSPDGLFDASAGAMNLLYFVIGTEIIELEQLKERYYEPGLLQKFMGFSSERIRPVGKLDEVPLYPKVMEETRIEDNVLQVKLLERNGGIGPVTILINGKEVSAEANPAPQRFNAKRPHTFTFDLSPFNRLFLKDPKETNIISIRTYNEEGWLKSAAYDIPYQYQVVNSRGGDTQVPTSPRKKRYDPKLYVLCIGTSEYTGQQLDLRYPDQDARNMATALNASGAALFNARGDSVEVHCLTTDTTEKVEPSIHWQFASKENITSTFAQIAKKAKAEDIFAVYLSGHGVTYGSAEKAQFHYLTQGISSFDLSDSYTRKTYTLSGNELTKMINKVPALKQVLIIDACNAGQITSSLKEGQKSLNSSQIRALDRMKDRTGMFVLSGSASNKVSYEASQYGQGLLTFSLLQGMKLVAAENNDNLDIMQLFQYARDQVPKLAKGIGGIQQPVLAFPHNGSSFDIGLVTDQVDIPITNVKPVFIRNYFQEERSFADVIGLGNAFATYFEEVSNEGAAAEYIYVDVNNFANAYSIKGRYQNEGDNIHVRGALFKGTESQGQFEVSGTVTELAQLVEDIIFEVQWMIEK